MPRGDGTGPAGMGSMTGRGAGFCAGLGVAGYANRRAGCGFGMGFGGGRAFGGGRGRRNWFHATGMPYWMRVASPQNVGVRPNPDAERQALRNQAQALQAEIDSIKRRLSVMDVSTERQ